MANPCQYGSRPADGAPAYFSFSTLDLIATMGAFWGEVSLELLGVSPRPYETAAFVADPPPADFPVATDWALLTFPPAAMVAGTYTRFKNLLLMNKWVTLAVCNAAPTARTGWTILGDIVATQSGTGIYIPENYPTFPPTAEDILVTVLARSAFGPVVNVGYFSAPPAAPVTYDTLAHVPNYLGGLPCTVVGDTSLTNNWGAALALHPNLTLALMMEDTGGETVTVRVSWRAIDTTPSDPPAPPDIVAPPTGFPETPDPPDCSTESLCAAIAAVQRQLDAIDARVQHTNAALVPPAVIPKGEPVLANPTDIGNPQGTPDVPLDPIPRPLDAVAAVIQIVELPEFAAHYGAEPQYYPSVLHVIPITAQGPLAAYRITRNPEVLLNIPAQVTHLALDPQPGVVAAIQWLSAPK